MSGLIDVFTRLLENVMEFDCGPELQRGVLNSRQTAALLCAVFTDSPICDHTTCFEGTAASYRPAAQQQQPASSGPDVLK